MRSLDACNRRRIRTSFVYVAQTQERKIFVARTQLSVGDVDDAILHRPRIVFIWAQENHYVSRFYLH